MRDRPDVTTMMNNPNPNPDPDQDTQAPVVRERVATRLTARTVRSNDTAGPHFREAMMGERFSWLANASCADLSITDFFVEAGHAIDPSVLNVCRRCPVRVCCLEHAYDMQISGGYFGGMSPGQRRTLDLDQARAFVAQDPPR
jgi:hypothetical protein